MYKGCSDPLIIRKTVEQEPNYHFKDGFGDVWDDEPDLSHVRPEHAVNAIYNLIQKYENMTLMCLGPLTNLAMLLKLYPGITKKLQKLWIMGGNRLGVGNVTSSAEFNFYQDPEAAFIAFESVECPINFLPLETVLNMSPQIPIEWRFKAIGDIKNELTKLMNPVEEKINTAWNMTHWYTYDAFVLASFINPKCIKKSAKFHLTVELGGFLTRGQVVLDHLKHKKPNCTVIEELNVELFKSMILNVVNDF